MISKAEKFYQKEKYKQAEEICLFELEKDPLNSDAARIQALLMLKTDRITQGIEFLNIAMAHDHQNPDNHNAMGHYFMYLGKYDEAINSFLKAYQLDSQNLEALLYLGDLNVMQNNWQKAIVFYALYININPNNMRMNQVYANGLENCVFKKVLDVQINAMQNVLLDYRVSVKRIIGHWIHALFNAPQFNDLSKAITDRNYNLSSLKSDINSEFFTQGVERLRHSAPIIEVFLTGVRKEFLSTVVRDFDNIDWNGHFDFLYALSMQCWINEYVFFISDEEKEWLAKLREKVESELSNNSKKDYICCFILLYSSYSSALDIKDIEKYVKSFKKRANDKFKKFVKIQIEDALEEQKIKKNIPQFTEIDDKISQIVREQYEQNPYPRSIEPVLIDNSIIVEKPQDILFAGCGTGHQIIGYSMQFPNAQYTAVDLSLSSLAYAIRQTKEKLNLKSKQIRFGHADILKLEEMGETYDRIFCTGVLHHMNEPEKGLAVLKKILRPHGAMHLALYSEIARQEIVKAREYIKEHGYKDNDDGIRQFRHDMIQLFAKTEHPNFMDFLVIPPDFYSLSECRDLVFHVQEHRYTIPQIKDMLDRYDLEFVTFNIRHKNIRATFCEKFGEDSIGDLMKWHEYEKEYRHSFIEMYDFTVRHKA